MLYTVQFDQITTTKLSVQYQAFVCMVDKVTGNEWGGKAQQNDAFVTS